MIGSVWECQLSLHRRVTVLVVKPAFDNDGWECLLLEDTRTGRSGSLLKYQDAFLRELFERVA